jgi:hypothetical protein
LIDGDPLGDTPYKASGYFEVDTLTDAGQLLFGTWTTSGFTSKTSEMKFQYEAGKITPIVLPEGDAPIGKWPKRVDIWSPVSVNQTGDAVLQLYDIDRADQGRNPWMGVFLWQHALQRLVEIPLVGTMVGDGLTIVQAGLPRGAINNNGEMSLVVDAKGTGRRGLGILFRDREGKLTPVALPGQLLPNGGRFVDSWFTTLNDAGRIGFTAARVSGGVPSAYLWENGTVSSLTQIASDAPGSGPIVAVWGAFVNNKNRNVLLEVGLKNANSGPTAPYLYVDGQLRPVAALNQDMPGGGKFRRLNGLGISFGNDAGQYAFTAQLDNGTGAYLVDADGKPSLIVRTGMDVPGLGKVSSVGAPYGSFGIGLNNKGQIALPLSVDSVPTIALLTPSAQ